MAWRRAGGGSLCTAINQHVGEHREDTKIGLQEAAVKHCPFAGSQTILFPNVDAVAPMVFILEEAQ